MKKIFRSLLMVLWIAGLLCACKREDGQSDTSDIDYIDDNGAIVSSEGMFTSEEIISPEETGNTEDEFAEQREKGYDLPIDEKDREEAESNCIKVMGLISDSYRSADWGEATNVILDEETLCRMQERIKEEGYPVTTTQIYSDMENYEGVDDFLTECQKGKSGSAVIYVLRLDGGIVRNRFIFDGKEMYLLSMSMVWDVEESPQISYCSYTRIKEWKYTKKGWFCYEMCVPEYPEVTEVVDGSGLIRVRPMTQENREISERCVLGIGYQGNNLLCSNWDTEHMEELDYNGMYEYLYAMKYQKNFNSENYPNGIPKEEFESLIMEFIPLTAEQIQEYAVFDEKTQAYAWKSLNCSNYTPTFFGTSIPEVTDIKENEDGTVTLMVDAVCDMMVCDDALITHALTVRFGQDGSFQYLGNKILNDGIKHIPDYQYRMQE